MMVQYESCAMVINSISSDSMMNAAQHYLKYGAQQSNSEHSDISESYQIGYGPEFLWSEAQDHVSSDGETMNMNSGGSTCLLQQYRGQGRGQLYNDPMGSYTTGNMDLAVPDWPSITSYVGEESVTALKNTSGLKSTSPELLALEKLETMKVKPSTKDSPVKGKAGSPAHSGREPFDWMKKRQYPKVPEKGKTRTESSYRKVYTQTQVTILESEFKSSPYITQAKKTEVAKLTELSERKVKIWFQNKRAHMRKKQKEATQAEKKKSTPLHRTLPANGINITSHVPQQASCTKSMCTDMSAYTNIAQFSNEQGTQNMIYPMQANHAGKQPPPYPHSYDYQTPKQNIQHLPQTTTTNQQMQPTVSPYGYACYYDGAMQQDNQQYQDPSSQFTQQPHVSIS